MEAETEDTLPDTRISCLPASTATWHITAGWAGGVLEFSKARENLNISAKPPVAGRKLC